MNIHHLTIIVGAVGLLTACASSQPDQSSGAAITIPSSAEVGVMTKTIVPTRGVAVSADDKDAVKTAKVVDKNRLICKRKKITGSGFKKKVCLTLSTWKEQQRLGKKTASDLQSRGGRINQPSGN